MCGIVGILKTASAGSIRNEVETLLPYLDHRGPDAWGSYGAPGIGLGHTRLSIIDPGLGHQPMVSDDSVLVYNGEVYNYLELRDLLRSYGMTFRTDSDTEVVQRALDFWGTEAFRKFNGQFALLYWHKKKKELIIGRDRYGIRPLYYLPEGGDVYFASELQVFDHLGERKRFWSEEDLFDHGLLWNTTGDRTVFKNIRSLEGGHFQVFRPGHCGDSVPYYVLGETYSEDNTSSFEIQKEMLREKLNESVRLRLRSDVPVGCYLSGGIDSSVTSLLAREINNNIFKSFSVSFADPSLDESEYQKLLVDSLGFDHHSLKVSAQDIEENFVEAARHFERPVFRTAPVPLYLLSGLVRQNDVKVVLTGEAADEILFGYDTNKELKLLSLWKEGATDDKVENVLLQLYPHLDHYADSQQIGFLKMYYEGFLKRFEGPLAGLSMRVSNNQVLANMFNRDWNIKFDFDSFEEKIGALLPRQSGNWNLLRKNQYLEMKTLLPGYLLSAQGDRMAMGHSVEGRFPFLDHNLVEWAFALPEASKIGGFNTKHILKESFKERIPSAIVNRPKRPYMAPDLTAFFPSGRKGRLVEEFLNNGIVKDYGLFDSRMIERFIGKIERRGIESAGYRDNMLISFLLSAQIIEQGIRNPQRKKIDKDKMANRILEEV
ncbi:MAG: asparagine synthase (glutamine-hydrolyzing) [Spirochaetales bacterium]|nr:asparagine synthase (glutamine-hydrolyzing) [Spirochaetales bacterium]